MSFAAVILAGGRATRLSGVDKVAIEVGGRSLLRRAVDAVAGAEPIVVVGAKRPMGVPVRWTVEQPPGGGPLAGLVAGMAAVPPEVDEVAVLAADLLGVTTDTVTRLRAALRAEKNAAGVVLVDSAGRLQWLIGVWHPTALRRALPNRPHGLSLRHSLGTLPASAIPAEPGETDDLDTPEDLDRLRRPD